MFKRIRDYFSEQSTLEKLVADNLFMRQLVDDLDHERALLQNKLLNIKGQLQGMNKAVRRRNHKVDVHRRRLTELEHVVGEFVDLTDEGDSAYGSNTVNLYRERFKVLLRRVPPVKETGGMAAD